MRSVGMLNRGLREKVKGTRTKMRRGADFIDMCGTKVLKKEQKCNTQSIFS
jgi:hypothetical protein